MLLWIIFIIVIIFLGFLFGLILDKRIQKKGMKKQPYIRLTLWIVIISFISVLIMSFSLLINISLLEDTKNALQAQAKGIAPINPEIIPQLINKDYNKYFKTFDVADLIVENADYNFKNESKFFPRKATLRLIVRNIGQGEAGNANFEIFQKDGTLYSPCCKNEIVEPFRFKYIEFDFWYKNCSMGFGREEYERSIENCKKFLGESGIYDFVLKINCNSCQWEKNPRCYSFSICLYNSPITGEEWCSSELEEKQFNLKQVNCIK